MKCAVATVAIGDRHRSSYAAIFRPSVEHYVARHGYDLVVFEESLAEPHDPFGSVVIFEKLRAPFHERLRGYDRVMVLDADVLASAAAPPFHTLDLGARIGIVDEWCQPTLEARQRFQVVNGLEVTTQQHYALAGFATDTQRVLNSGVLVCSPRIHGPVFRELVARYVERAAGHPRGGLFEQTMLSFELQNRGLAHVLPAAWNCIWPLHRRTPKWGAASATAGPQERWADLLRLRELLAANFFLHMTGGLDHDLAFVARSTAATGLRSGVARR